MTKTLPRHPSDVIVNGDSLFGWNGQLRVNIIRRAFKEFKFKYYHPFYTGVEYAAANEKAITEFNKHLEDLQDSSKNGENLQTEMEVSTASAAQELRDRGSYQPIEEQAAEVLLDAPVMHENNEFSSIKLRLLLKTF